MRVRARNKKSSIETTKNKKKSFHILWYTLFGILFFVAEYLFEISKHQLFGTFLIYFTLCFILVIIFILVYTSGYFMSIKRYFSAHEFTKSRHKNIGFTNLQDKNFLNHHNYFKNLPLEKKFKQYKTKMFLRNNVIGIGLGILFTYFFPNVVFEILAPYLVIFIAIIPLVMKDRIMGKKTISPKKYYFRNITPRYYQKIKQKIFFY